MTWHDIYPRAFVFVFSVSVLTGMNECAPLSHEVPRTVVFVDFDFDFVSVSVSRQFPRARARLRVLPSCPSFMCAFHASCLIAYLA